MNSFSILRNSEWTVGDAHNNHTYTDINSFPYFCMISFYFFYNEKRVLEMYFSVFPNKFVYDG